MQLNADGLFRFYEFGSVPEFRNTEEAQIRLNDWEIQITKSKWQDIAVPFTVRKLRSINVRCAFNLEEKSSPDPLLLVGSGIKGTAKIFLNGQLIKYQPNNYGPFRIRLDSNRLQFGRMNTIRLEISRPRSLSHGFPSYVAVLKQPQLLGIARPLYIRSEGANRIENVRYRVNTINGNRAEISYAIQLNLADALLTGDSKARLYHRIERLEGSPVLSREHDIQRTFSEIRGTVEVDTSLLWAPDSPILMNANLSLRIDGERVHSEQLTFGLRAIDMHRDQLRLNGRSIDVKGINYYEILDYLRNDRYYQTLRQDFIKIKSMKFNAVRLPHYFPDASMVHLADSLGLMLFPELSIWRYPASLYTNDDLLENAKQAIRSLNNRFTNQPALVALGLGQEIPIHKSVAQKFMLILKSFTHSNSDWLTYLSPIPRKRLAPEKAADFYVLDIYRPLQDLFGDAEYNFNSYLLAGKAGIVKSRDVFRWDKDVSSGKHAIYLKRETFSATSKLNFQGGFIESFQDWPLAKATHLNILDDTPNMMPTGLLTLDRTQKHWVSNLNDLWRISQLDMLPETQKRQPTNFFSIVIFFSVIIFFTIYRRQARLRDNFTRALKRPYGFFVDMRERRIIPIGNSILMGAFSAITLAVFLGSYLYYYHNSYGYQEILGAILIPVNLYDTFLYINQYPWAITLALLLLLFFIPIFISLILKIISILGSERIRFRQAMAIGFWSGIPFIFMLPVALVHHHALHYPRFSGYLIWILLVFLVWSHVRLINGIRVLFTTRVGRVAIILLLSYLIPVLILWIAFKTTPYWSEYLGLMFNAHSLF